jgi:hypothetical protein
VPIRITHSGRSLPVPARSETGVSRGGRSAEDLGAEAAGQGWQTIGSSLAKSCCRHL